MYTVNPRLDVSPSEDLLFLVPSRHLLLSHHDHPANHIAADRAGVSG
jgi:hypothetical protein